MPVHIGIQWPTAQEARNCPRGDIKLGFCPECGFIRNVAFDPSRLEYSEAYENPLYYSYVFQDYAHSLAQRLIDRYSLKNKEIIEIGCGKGDFLKLICELGNNRGLGFDKSYEPDRDGSSESSRIRIIRDHYSEEYAEYTGDLICCRFVFEHIEKPAEFLSIIRRSIGKRENTVVYFEVPDVLSILRDLAIWDIIYEHCSHFSPESLRRVFRESGFRTCDVGVSYGGQFLSIEAVPAVDNTGVESHIDINHLTEYVDSFPQRFQKKLDEWRTTIEQLGDDGRQVVLWGAGSKAVSLLNMLGIRDQVEYVVDINPHKHGKHLAGTGQQIVSPEFLRKCEPEVIIVMNPVYKAEIAQITNDLGLQAEFLCA